MTDRYARIRISKDGGHTWGHWRTKDLGQLGEYQDKVRVRMLRLGMARNLMFDIEVSSPIAGHILAAVAQIDGAAV